MTLNQSVLLFQDTWWDSSLNLLIQKDWTEPKHFMEAFQKSYFCRLVQDNPNVPGESGLMASDLKWHCWIIYPCFPAVWIHLKINAAKTAAPGATSCRICPGLPALIIFLLRDRPFPLYFHPSVANLEFLYLINQIITKSVKIWYILADQHI